jgi:hypothetical protein
VLICGTKRGESEPTLARETRWPDLHIWNIRVRENKAIPVTGLGVPYAYILWGTNIIYTKNISATL